MMLRVFLIASAASLLSYPSWADEKSEAVQAVETNSDDAAKALNDFIARAVDDGLLERPGGNPDGPAPDYKPPEVAGSEGCTVVSEADFRAYKDYFEFAQLVSLENSDEVPEPSERIQARISLGLYSEARSLISTLGLDNGYLSSLATLMENQSVPTADYFAKFANCSPAANFWHSVAQLAAHDETGASGLEDGISFYRSLPFQMQVDVVTIAVPALEGHNQKLLAGKLMSIFSKEDIANSTGLQFSAALLDENAAKKIDEFIVRPEFRFKALGVIVQRGDTLSTPQRELLLDEVANIIDHETDERQLMVAVKFALQEFGQRSSISEMIALAKLPKLQSPVARNTIFQSLAKVISKDLQSDDQLTVLSTFQALIDHAEIIDGHTSTAGLFQVASKRANALGYRSLSVRLASKDIRQVEKLVQRAELAYRKKDRAGVYALADQRPKDPTLSLLAAKAALQASDKDNLTVFQARLLEHPDMALQLVKDDAASGKWLVSESVYLAAGSSPDISTAAKAANILALRRGVQAAKTKSTVSIGATEQILARSTKDLTPKMKEVN